MSFFKINNVNLFLKLPKIFAHPKLINFGCKEDGVDHRDWLFKDSELNCAAPLKEISIKQYFKPVSNQYSIGSCVANATADAIEMQQALRLGSPDKVRDLSRLFIYWNARNLDFPPSANIDDGSKVRLAFDSLSKYGVCSEDTWKYDVSKVNVKPGMLAYKEAIQHRITGYYRITGSGDDLCDQIIKALSANHPIVFATTIGVEFRTINSDNPINAPTGKTLGGHCMVITGWSDSKQAFEIRNSWGENWGVNGYFFMSKEYMTSSLSRDFWVPTCG